MHGVKAPEQRPFMGQAMGPVEAEFGNRHAQQHLQRQRPAMGPPAGTRRRHRLRGAHDAHRQDQGLHRQLAEQRVADIRHELAVIGEPLPLMGHQPLEQE